MIRHYIIAQSPEAEVSFCATDVVGEDGIKRTLCEFKKTFPDNSSVIYPVATPIQVKEFYREQNVLDDTVHMTRGAALQLYIEHKGRIDVIEQSPEILHEMNVSFENNTDQSGVQ